MLSDFDCESYAESTDTEDPDDFESSYSGHAQNILSSLGVSIEKIDDFLKFQRRFAHGDFVCSISHPSKQFGLVVDINMNVDLETRSNELIRAVNSRKLVKVRPFFPGDYVSQGHWIGRVSKVVDRVTILLNNGCKIMVDDADDLIFPSNLFEFESNPHYHQGQHVSVKYQSASKNGRWLPNSWKPCRIEGTICHVEVGLVHVKWTTFMCMKCSPSPPDYLQAPKMLTLLSCFSYANWQLGEFCQLDSKMTDKDPKALINNESSEQLCKEMYSIAKIKIKVDVLWQNGEVSIGLDPEALLPVCNIGDHDFWPGQFVKEKATGDDFLGPSFWHLGVVKSVESQEQIVKVKWIDAEFQQAANFERENEEIFCAYELIQHPDASFSLGDIVIQFQNCDNSEENISNIQVTNEQAPNSSLLHATDYEKGACLANVNYCRTSCAPRIGYLIGFKNEGMEVKWVNGLISIVHPYDIIGLDRIDEFDTSSSAHHVSQNVQNEISEAVKLQKNEAENDPKGDSRRGLWDASFLLHPLKAIEFFKNIVLRLFSVSASSNPSYQKMSNFNGIDMAEISMLSTDEHQTLNCGAELIERADLSVGSEKADKFKQFDCVLGYLDHYFASNISKSINTLQAKNVWLKRIHQEWSILKESLPESICVRVYEERVDLLRVSIAGQPGTPYYHGLFFFDIHLTENYPQEPPLVHYHSGGLRLNPNLYESGKICLSLLNTWTGRDTEVWNPHSSTILQLLLSFQALVLNENPYFNEAGYDKQIGRAEADRNSMNYNENTFLLSCKSMMYILKQPPKHFEAHVEKHFIEHAHDILQACKAYMDGARVGSYGSGTGSQDGTRGNSAGFRMMLAKIIPTLISCFAAKGIDCSLFENKDDQGAGFSCGIWAQIEA